MFKIVQRDNFARDYNGGSSEQLLADNIKRKEDAETMAKAMNDRYGSEHGSFFAAVEPQEYQLYVFEGY